MRSSIFFAAALIGLIVQGSLNAQTKDSNLVALLDVAKVFENHTEFKTRINAIKQESVTYSSQMKQQAGMGKKIADLLQDVSPDTSTHKELAALLEYLDSNLKEETTKKKQELLEREAKVYRETYDEICEVVSKIASEYGISLVLKYDSSEPKVDSRTATMKRINSSVIFQRHLDLTSLVIARVNDKEISDSSVEEHLPATRRFDPAALPSLGASPISGDVFPQR